MFAVPQFKVDELDRNREDLINGLKLLFTDDDFRQSIDAATNTPALFRHRIEAVTRMISRLVYSS